LKDISTLIIYYQNYLIQISMVISNEQSTPINESRITVTPYNFFKINLSPFTIYHL
jgi:hypothetical protein